MRKLAFVPILLALIALFAPAHAATVGSFPVGGVGGGGAITTFGADLAGSTATNQWVQSISGNAGGGGTVPLNITTLSYASGQVSPTITQASTAAASGQNLSIDPQASTNANGTPGSVVVNIPALTGTGNPGEFLVEQASTIVAALGPWQAVPSRSALYMQVTPGASNFALVSDGTSLSINAPGGGGVLTFLSNNGGTGLGTWGTNGLQVGSSTSSFGSGTGVIGLNNASVVPTTNPSAGGILYSTNANGNAELNWRDTAGVVTQLAPHGSATFTASGSWVSPITGIVRVQACGGGGGGGGAESNNGATPGGGGCGGGGAQVKEYSISAVAGTSYTVTIGGGGAAGTGGTSGASPFGTNGGNGTATIFLNGGTTLAQWPGATGGSAVASGSETSGFCYGGSSNVNTTNWDLISGGGVTQRGWQGPGYGGSFIGGTAVKPGNGDEQGLFSGGAAGTNSSGGGGAGGGAGGYGAGAAGGNGGTSGNNGTAGTAASANTCAGGGAGGGAGANVGGTAVNGAAGGSGKMVVFF